MLLFELKFGWDNAKFVFLVSNRRFCCPNFALVYVYKLTLERFFARKNNLKQFFKYKVIFSSRSQVVDQFQASEKSIKAKQTIRLKERLPKVETFYSIRLKGKKNRTFHFFPSFRSEELFHTPKLDLNSSAFVKFCNKF